MEWYRCLWFGLIVWVLAWISYGDICRNKIGKLSTAALFCLSALYLGTGWIMEGKASWSSFGLEALLSLFAGLFLAGMVEVVNLLFFQLKGMGGGDIRLVFVMGFLLGLDGGLAALLVGLILALGYGLVKMRSRSLGPIPMGPFLTIGILMVVSMKNLIL